MRFSKYRSSEPDRRCDERVAVSVRSSGWRKRAGLVVDDALDQPEHDEYHQQWEQYRRKEGQHTTDEAHEDLE